MKHTETELTKLKRKFDIDKIENLSAYTWMSSTRSTAYANLQQICRHT